MTPTAFEDLDDYLALPRNSGLAVSADGSRVVTTVAALNDARSEHSAAVWELDPNGERPAHRLTRGADGESSPTFTAGGDLLFLSSRPGAEKADHGNKPPASLWRLPAAGGEAVEGVRLPGGISACVPHALPTPSSSGRQCCPQPAISTTTAGCATSGGTPR